MKGVGRRTQLLDDLRNRRRYWKLKKKIEKDEDESLSIEHREEIKVIFRKSVDLLISSILNNNTNKPGWRLSKGLEKVHVIFKCGRKGIIIELVARGTNSLAVAHLIEFHKHGPASVPLAEGDNRFVSPRIRFICDDGFLLQRLSLSHLVTFQQGFITVTADCWPQDHLEN